MAYLFILAGIFTAVCTIKKPNFFWEHRKAMQLRKIIGDKATTVFYLALSFILVVFGLIEAAKIIQQ